MTHHRRGGASWAVTYARTAGLPGDVEKELPKRSVLRDVIP